MKNRSVICHHRYTNTATVCSNEAALVVTSHPLNNVVDIYLWLFCDVLDLDEEGNDALMLYGLVGII